MTKRVVGIILAVSFGIWFQPWASASMLQLDAPPLFAKSVTHHLRLAEASGDVELEVGELFEDDGPASGHSYQAPGNQETVTPQTWIKKELLIPNPQARAAYLVVLSEEPFEALINGIPQKPGENQSGRKSYKTYSFDPGVLGAGCNEIVLRTSGKVWIARDDEFALGSHTRTKHPHCSAKSNDAGTSWDYDRLNQAHYVLEPGKESGTLRVHLDTETPSFETFVAEIDGGEKKTVASGFLWTLHPGRNDLRIKPRNVAGREGIPSWVAFEYSP